MSEQTSGQEAETVEAKFRSPRESVPDAIAMVDRFGNNVLVISPTEQIDCMDDCNCPF
jgi:hypothetical protein